ncbi:MAG: glycosyltransferase family 4 protein [Phycisphaeraceae bacterium]
MVSYTAMLCRGLAALGVRPWVLTGRVAPDCEDLRAVAIHPWRQRLSPWTKLWSRIEGLLQPGQPGWQQRVWTRALVEGVERVRAAAPDGGLSVLELEEAWGLAARMARASPVPVVVRLHGPWFLNGSANGEPADRAYRRRVRLEGRGLAAAAGVTAPSRDVLERTRRAYGLPLEHASVLPNPIELPGESETWRPAGCDPQRVLFVGRFDRHKGGDVALDAFAQLARELPKLRLVMVGPDRGVRDDAGRRWSLEAYLGERLGDVRGRVEVLGELEPERLGLLRRQAMVTIVPSRYEVFGYTAVEAMAAGCPVVVSEAGGLAEMVQDGRNGLFAQPGDAADLARQVRRVVEDPELARRLGGQARADVGERYTPEVVARRTLAFYGEVVARCGRTRTGGDDGS